MGNKQSRKKKNIKTDPYKGNKDPYPYTSIGDKIKLFGEPLKYFLSADNNICIIVGQTHIAYFDYDSKSNRFKQTFETHKISNIKDVIYNPYHQLLIFWTETYTEYPPFTQCSFKRSELEIKTESKDFECVAEYPAMNVVGRITRIVTGHFIKQCELLMLITSGTGSVGSIGCVTVMKWNNITQEYKYVNHCVLQYCENIIACDVHESRRKMVLITKYKHHWYLNIYSIKQMLINIDEKQEIAPTLCVSRLIYWHESNKNSIRTGFKDTYPQLFTFDETDPGVNGYYERIAAEPVNSKVNGVKYVLNTFFGINPLNCRLLFNYHGDKVLFQSIAFNTNNFNRSRNLCLHAEYEFIKSYDHFGGYLNDFGALHIIDINTGDSLYSIGSKSSDKGIAWTLTDHLIVFKRNRLNQRCKFTLEGFESQTNIAECLYNIIEVESNSFSWDLCLLIAVYRGSERYYKEITLVNRDNVHKNAFGNLTTKFHHGTCIPQLYSGWNKEIYNDSKWFSIVTKQYNGKCVIRFYDAESVEATVSKKEDVLLNFMHNNGLICRDLINNTDIFGDFLQNK